MQDLAERRRRATDHLPPVPTISRASLLFAAQVWLRWQHCTAGLSSKGRIGFVSFLSLPKNSNFSFYVNHSEMAGQQDRETGGGATAKFGEIFAGRYQSVSTRAHLTFELESTW